MSARRFASAIDITKNGNEGKAKIGSSASSEPAKASPACTRPSAIAASMPADLMPGGGIKACLIAIFPALSSVTCLAKAVRPTPGIALAGYSVGISQTVWARIVAACSSRTAPASIPRNRIIPPTSRALPCPLRPWRRHRQPQEAHYAAERSKSGAERQCKRRAIMFTERKAQRRERRTQGLSGQARGGDNAAGAAAAMRRRARHQCAQIGGLKETESDPAHHHAPDDIGDAGFRGQRRQQHHANAQQREANAAEDADRITVRQ